MKKSIIIYGIIAGAITASWFIISLAIYKGNEEKQFENGMWYGYASMLLAFSLIFVCIKNFRDKHNQGFISFGQAFKIGLFITLIASTIYVVSWLIDYYFFIPDFMQKYSAIMINKMKAEGASQAEISKKTIEMAEFNKMYQNPFFNALLTYAEIFPVGLIVTLISSLILKKNQ